MNKILTLILVSVGFAVIIWLGVKLIGEFFVYSAIGTCACYICVLYEKLNEKEDE